MKYVIYAVKNCPYCEKIYNYMVEEKKKFAYVLLHDLDDDLQKIKDKHNWKTVPMVFEGDENGKEQFLGGCEDAIQHFLRRRNTGDPA